MTRTHAVRTVDARRLAALLAEGGGDAVPGPRRSEPAYRELAAGVQRLVGDGRIPLDVRLPGERSLATALGMSRTTVAAAYTLLRERGYLTVSQGAQARIRLPAGAVDPTAAPDIEVPDDVVDLAFATLPADAGVVRRAYEAALAGLPAVLPGHGYDPHGRPALREAIAARYRARGLPTESEQILVTTGASRAISLVVETFTAPGDGVLVEAPTYPNVLDTLTARGRRPVPVSFPAEPLPGAPGGWDLAAMESALAQAGPRLAYLVPDFHNPTGRLMSTPERERLCRAARRAGTRIVVDETLADLALDVDPPPPMAAVDRSVITVGSASKSFWAGLRIGWIRAERAVVEELARHRAIDDLGTPIVEQLAAAHVVATSADTLPARLDRLRTNRAAVLDVLAERLPDWTVTSHAVGGLALWVRLPVAVGTAVCAEATGHGVRLVPGPRFGVGGGFERHLRLPFTRDADELRRAMHGVADAYEAVVGGRAAGGDVEPGLRLA